MATVTVNINIAEFEKQLEEITAVLSDKESTLKPVAIELVELMTERIHENGLASDGSKIGTYQDSYLKMREARGLGSGSDVVLFLTRKLFNSWGAFATDNGWAVGFIDDSAEGGVTSRMKIMFAEERFGKKIINPTAEEEQYANNRLLEIVNNLLSPYANP